MTGSSEQNHDEPPRLPVDRPWVRSRPVRTMFRPREYRELQAISKGWGVPVATAVWAIVHDQLSRWQKRPPELGRHGLAIAAGLAVTRYATERRRNSPTGPALE